MAIGEKIARYKKDTGFLTKSALVRFAFPVFVLRLPSRAYLEFQTGMTELIAVR